ncbi:glycosyltransferase [Bradyrhizobium sp. LHD-71]|uniref:glycosyltransferase n=1 Tax=Bradyrhizobium sp. LHD-71 TaxID=3072141 RepID=UPI00280DCC56|nr:glycosyltransferase [Bradyrhizobium sp. LHD-71]MDQ8729771.1 glycosyltransferase [Bradyrhizobium sp. LHD-71]
MTIYVDHTHLGRRRVTGIERITSELFSPHALAPVELTPVTASGTAGMMLTQTFGLPLRLSDPSAVLVCPGFPPSPLLLPFASRVIPYIHDLFLVTRPGDLNARAKLYMARPFRLAVTNYPRFLVNSLDTARKLKAFCRSNAEIVVYRPKVQNVFGVEQAVRDRPTSNHTTLRLLSIGTVEPRKNYTYAARIIRELRQNGFADATLEIVGRNGWGSDWQLLEREPGVILSGYRSADEVRQRLQEADALLCTSHEEGLGLPLLEAQYAGIPIIAPEGAVFREVLGESGVFIDPTDCVAAAKTIARIPLEDGWRTRFRELDMHNLARWNALADNDRTQVSQMIASIEQNVAGPSPDRSRRVTEPRGNTN